MTEITGKTVSWYRKNWIWIPAMPIAVGTKGEDQAVIDLVKAYALSKISNLQDVKKQRVYFHWNEMRHVSGEVSLTVEEDFIPSSGAWTGSSKHVTTARIKMSPTTPLETYIESVTDATTHGMVRMIQGMTGTLQIGLNMTPFR